MPDSYFAIGTTLANMVNIETVIPHAPHVLPGAYIPFMGPVKRRVASGASQRNGSINVPIQIDIARHADLTTLVNTYWGDWETSSADLYVSWLMEDGFWAPFNVRLDRPYIGQDYEHANKRYLQRLIIPGNKWTIQTTAWSSSDTITTADRRNEVDTSGGDVTLDLFAAADVEPDTIYSFVVSVAGNSIILDGDSSETIDGMATQSTTTRLDIISNGVDAWTIV
jgi:hypothetical protein